MEKTLGIIGGMGPLATVKLFEKIVTLTDARSDQEHIRILIDNNTFIPDRTSYLVGIGEDPREQLIDSAKKLESAGADFLVMPCNTAHYFYNDILQQINIPFLHMIEETANIILEKYPGIEKVGLLATVGTCKTGVYADVFQKKGIQVLQPSEEHQQYVTDLIYGIKENRKVNIDHFYTAVNALNSAGCQVCILGCTELSVAYDLFHLKGTYVDALDVISRKAIEFAGKRVLEK
ncbi:MAG: aspartate/glutamate racemase family protein [Bacillota bacterium]